VLALQDANDVVGCFVDCCICCSYPLSFIRALLVTVLSQVYPLSLLTLSPHTVATSSHGQLRLLVSVPAAPVTGLSSASKRRSSAISTADSAFGGNPFADPYALLVAGYHQCDLALAAGC